MKFLNNLKLYPKKYNYIAISLTYTLVILGILIYSSSKNTFINLPTCPIYKYLHISCPICGSTRATLALLDFNIITSIKYNPIVLYTLIFSTLYIILETIQIITFKKTRKNNTTQPLNWNLIIIIGLIICLINFLLKLFFYTT